MRDTSHWDFSLKLEVPMSKYLVLHYHKGIFSASDNTANTLSTTSAQTQIGMSVSCAVSLLFSITRDCVLFQMKSKLRKKHRQQNIFMEACRGISLFPERFRTLCFSTDRPHFNPECTTNCGDSPLF